MAARVKQSTRQNTADLPPSLPICKGCLIEFKPKKFNQEFHSKACKDRFHNALRRNRRTSLLVRRGQCKEMKSGKLRAYVDIDIINKSAFLEAFPEVGMPVLLMGFKGGNQ